MTWHIALASLNRLCPPLQRAKLCKMCKIPLVRRKHCDAGPNRAGGYQCVVCQSCLSNSLESILLRQPGQNLSSIGPIAQAWDKQSLRSFKIAFQLFQNPMIVWIGASVKLL